MMQKKLWIARRRHQNLQPVVKDNKRDELPQKERETVRQKEGERGREDAMLYEKGR